MKRPFLFALALLVLLAGAGLSFAAPADSAPFIGDCKDAPEPESPYSGLAGFFHLSYPFEPSTADPFVDGSGATIMEQYGHAGLTWATYDLGCGGAARDPWATFVNGWANLWIELGAKPLNMATAAVGYSVVDRPDEWLRAFDGPLDTATKAVREHPFQVFVPIAVLIGLAYYAAVARGTRTSAIASHILRLILTVALSCVVMAGPLRVAHLLDGGLQWGTREAQEATGGSARPTQTTAMVHRSLWQAWLAGEFGSADSPTAKKYGPDLFKSTVYSYDEWDRTRQDPEGRERLRTAKMDRFKEIAAEVEKEDKDAYRNLQGKVGGNRLAYSILGFISVLGGDLLVLVSFVLLGLALLRIRAVIVAVPVASIPAMLPAEMPGVGGSKALPKLGNWFVASSLKAIIYLFTGGLVSLLTGAALAAPDTSGFVRLLMVLFVNGVAWAALLAWYAKRGVGIGKLLVKVAARTGEAAVIGHVAGMAIDQHRVPSGGETLRQPPMPDPPPRAGLPVTLPPPPFGPGNGFEMSAPHPGYRVGEARVRGAALPPAGGAGSAGRRHETGRVTVRAPGLPTGTPELTTGTPELTAGPGGLPSGSLGISPRTGPLAPIDVAPVVHNDGSEVYTARPRTTSSFRSDPHRDHDHDHALAGVD